MFENPKIKVTYNARLRRMRAEFLAGECFKSRKPPENLLWKSEQRLSEELEEGHIEVFEVFFPRLEELWTYVREHRQHIDPRMPLKITLAQGARLYEELKLSPPPKDSAALARLSCSFSPRKMPSVSYNTFVFNVMEQLRRSNVVWAPDRAQLRYLFLLLQHGQALEDVVLVRQPRVEDYSELNYLVRFHQEQRFATLHIIDPEWLRSEERRVHLCQKAFADVERLNTKNIPLNLMYHHTLAKLRSLANKIQAIGFNLPYDLLIACDASYSFDEGRERRKEDQGGAAKADLPRWQIRLGALANKKKSEFFQIETDARALQASIVRVDAERLDQVRAMVDRKWLIEQLQNSGIAFGYEAFLEPMLEAIKKGLALTRMKVAEGQAGAPGEQPFLHLVTPTRRVEDQDSVNLREMQNSQAIQAGQLLAEVRFLDGVPGRTVFGTEAHALGSAAEAGYLAGDGVELRDDARFYAIRSGILQVEDKTVRCLEAYVHPGNINLSTGNLTFEGTVVVKGDIESGASVLVKGNLVVEGTIGPSQVSCSGDLDVKGGIVTGAQGWVKVGGRAQASFIENSQVTVRGDLHVQRSILNSRVICGGNIIILDSGAGLMMGGAISAWGSMRTARYGMPQGRRSECTIGSNFTAELRLLHLNKRLEKMQAYAESLQHGQKELEGGPQTKATQVLRTQMAQRLKRAQGIAKRLQVKRDEQEQKMRWNTSATLMVTGILDKSVALVAGGRHIANKESIQGILVVAAPFRGSSLVDLKELEAFRNAMPEAIIADPPSGKKS